MISIVSPIFNEEDNLEELHRRVAKAFEMVDEDFELLLVENGSSDRSFEIIQALQKKDPRVKYIQLSRNFGHQGGLLAGIYEAKGEALITMDGDLQHPPELILELIQHWKGGCDVVYTQKIIEHEKKGLLLLAKKIFYRSISYISNIKLSYGQSDFRLLDQKVTEVIKSIPEKNLFLRGIVEWVGFKQIGVAYKVENRNGGESKFSFFNYLSFALNGIFSFSTVPLKLFLWLGISIAFLCGLYAMQCVALGILNQYFDTDFNLPPGWATIVVSITFLSSIQLIGIGILGEYIGRVFEQSKNRPSFIIKNKSL